MNKKKRILRLLQYFVFICITHISLYTCKQGLITKENTPFAVNTKIIKDSIIFNHVVISGTTDDLQAFESLNILNYSDFFAGRRNDVSNVNLNNSEDIILDSILNPQIIELMMFGSKPYRTRVFVIPGDSININIKNGKLKFIGKNESHYNFYLKLDSLDNQWTKNGYNGNIHDYKEKSLKLYNKREKFFNNYVQEHNIVSKEFINHVKSELKFEYLYNLIDPRSIKSEGSNGYANNLNGIISTLENESNLIDGDILNFDNYFDNITIEEFNKPELINNDYFKRSLVEFIRHYFTNQDYIDYTRENFEAELNFIQKNLKGEIAKYATGRLIYDFYQKGFGQDKTNSELLENVIEKYQTQQLNKSYHEIITDVGEGLKVINSIIPEEIKNEKLLTFNGDTITLATALNINNKVKFLMFWAFEDRCKPCVNGIKQLKSMKGIIDLNNEIEWIYISIDNRTKNWINDSNTLKKYLKKNQQYKIVDSMMNSRLLKFFRVRKYKTIELPRYIIIDNKDNILLNNAPRPSDSIAFKKVLSKISIKRY